MSIKKGQYWSVSGRGKTVRERMEDMLDELYVEAGDEKGKHQLIGAARTYQVWWNFHYQNQEQTIKDVLRATKKRVTDESYGDDV